MNKTKVTKRDHLTTLKAILAGEIAIAEVDKTALSDFIDNELDNLDKKAIAAKARAAKQKEAGDALRETIKGLLSTDEFTTIPTIVKALGDENITPQKVTPRLAQLVDLGLVERGDVKIEGKDGTKARTITGYRLLG